MKNTIDLPFFGRELERLHDSYKAADDGIDRRRILDMIEEIHALLFRPTITIEDPMKGAK